MKFNNHFTKELYNSFIYGAIVSYTILIISLVLFKFSNDDAFLLQGITWIFSCNTFYFFINKNKKNEYQKLIFINLVMLFYIYFMVYR